MTDQIIATTTETTEATPKRYRCRHIFIDGHRCGSPSLRGEPFCYYHHTSRGFADEKRLRRTWAEFELPPLEDRSSVLAAINEVLQRIAGNNIPVKQAGLLLYGLQIASLNLPESSEVESQSDAYSKEQTVEEVIISPPYGDLAPIAELIDSPQSTILPNLNANEDLAAPQTHNHTPPPQTHHTAPPQKHVISTEGGAFAAAVERPLYFAVAQSTNPPLPTKPEINTPRPAPVPSTWYPNNCHAYEKRTSRPPHSAHRHQAAQRRRSRRRHALHGLQLA